MKLSDPGHLFVGHFKITDSISLLVIALLCLVPQSCLTLCDPMDYSPPGSSVHGDSPVKNTGEGCHALCQGSSQPSDWSINVFFLFFSVGRLYFSRNVSTSSRVSILLM